MRFAAVNGAARQGGQRGHDHTRRRAAASISSRRASRTTASSPRPTATCCSPPARASRWWRARARTSASRSPRPPRARRSTSAQVVGGRIGIYGGLVRNAGTLNATTAMVGENGNIILKAAGDVRLEGGVVKAAAIDGGAIRIEGDRVVQGAAIDASGASGGTREHPGEHRAADRAHRRARHERRRAAPSTCSRPAAWCRRRAPCSTHRARPQAAALPCREPASGACSRRRRSRRQSSAGVGGDDQGAGRRHRARRREARCERRRGRREVLVGGDFQGANPDVPNAQYGDASPPAHDHRRRCDGGRRRRRRRRVGGRINLVRTARSRRAAVRSPATADGSRSPARPSVRHRRDVVDASAPQGAAGTLLIDPKNIIIAAVAPTGTPVSRAQRPEPGCERELRRELRRRHRQLRRRHGSADDHRGSRPARVHLRRRPGSPRRAQLISSIVGSLGDRSGRQRRHHDAVSGTSSCAARAGAIARSPAAQARSRSGDRRGRPSPQAAVPSARPTAWSVAPTPRVGAARVDQFVSGVRFALVNPGWDNGRGR